MITINVATQDGRIITLYLETSWKLSKLRHMIQDGLNIPVACQQLYLDGVLVPEADQTIENSNLKDGDVLFVKYIHLESTVPSTSQLTGDSVIDLKFSENAHKILEEFKPGSLAYKSLESQNHALATAISSGDVNKVTQVLKDEHEKRIKDQIELKRRLIQAHLDPLNPKSQSLIQEQIVKDRINENYTSAKTFTPELFGDVVMLYVNVEINKVTLRAIVDTGSQNTIMSKSCAERCNLLNMIDTRFRGIAIGIGSMNTVGRIHLANLKIGQLFLPVSFVVLDNTEIDFILGLDILRRHQCVIDLKDNCMNINDQKIYFLAEKDLNKTPRINDTKRITNVPNIETDSGINSNLEQKIRSLMETLNITYEYALRLLEIANGNEDLAASFILPQ